MSMIYWIVIKTNKSQWRPFIKSSRINSPRKFFLLYLTPEVQKAALARPLWQATPLWGRSYVHAIIQDDKRSVIKRKIIVVSFQKFFHLLLAIDQTLQSFRIKVFVNKKRGCHASKIFFCFFSGGHNASTGNVLLIPYNIFNQCWFSCSFSA